jgi:hypothetical protein
MAITSEKRREVPLSVKLEVALDQLISAWRKLGKIPDDVKKVELELDHLPPLALRPVNQETGQHVPHQHSPRHLVWMVKKEHREKTTGRRGESKLSIRDGDQQKIAKQRRRDKKEVERQEAKAIPPGGKSKGKPKAKIPSPPKKPRKPQKRASGYVRRGV